MMLPPEEIEQLENTIYKLYRSSNQFKDYKFIKSSNYIEATLIAIHNTPFTVRIEAFEVTTLFPIKDLLTQQYLKNAIETLDELRIEAKLIHHIDEDDPQFEDYVAFNHLRAVLRDMLREKFDIIKI